MHLAKPRHPLRALLRSAFVLVASGTTTLGLFLVLPLMQSIAAPPAADLVLQSMATTEAPPPPPPPEEEPEKPPTAEEKPPELVETPQNLDLSQLELALNPGLGGGGTGGGEIAVKLGVGGTGDGDASAGDALFSMADLDQKPRAIYQPSPSLDAATRKKGPGSVFVVFVVDQEGRVENPIVQKSSDQAFERPALAAVKQWKFEPGKRNGQAVRFRMRVPITFSQR